MNQPNEVSGAGEQRGDTPEKKFAGHTPWPDHCDACEEQPKREVQPLPADVPDLFKLAYIPGVWKCPKCDFELCKQTLAMNLGQVGTSPTDRQSEECPNDGTWMIPVTYRERVAQYEKRCFEEIDKVRALEAQLSLLTSYAKGVELPALDVTEEDTIELGKQYIHARFPSWNELSVYETVMGHRGNDTALWREWVLATPLEKRERQMKAALAQLSGVELTSANRLKEGELEVREPINEDSSHVAACILANVDMDGATPEEWIRETLAVLEAEGRLLASKPDLKSVESAEGAWKRGWDRGYVMALKDQVEDRGITQCPPYVPISPTGETK